MFWPEQLLGSIGNLSTWPTELMYIYHLIKTLKILEKIIKRAYFLFDPKHPSFRRLVTWVLQRLMDTVSSVQFLFCACFELFLNVHSPSGKKEVRYYQWTILFALRSTVCGDGRMQIPYIGTVIPQC